MRPTRLRVVVCAVGSVLLGCAPGARALRGAPTPRALPPAQLNGKPTLLRFVWTYKDETFEATGEGAVRVAPPDHARLDFFLTNGLAVQVARLLRIERGPHQTR